MTRTPADSVVLLMKLQVDRRIG